MARELPPRSLPTPHGISAGLAEAIAADIAPTIAMLSAAPEDAAGWPAYLADLAADDGDRIAALRARFPVEITREVIAGVTVWRVAATDADTARLYVHIHGGAYVAGAGEAGLNEAILMAHRARVPVLSIDYRMPPAHPFPAAVDDVVTVWRALLERQSAETMAVFGTSAGGALAVAMAVKALGLGLPLPAALAPSTPWSDLRAVGDSYHLNAHADCAVPLYTGLLERAALLYAGPDRLDDPLASPIHADLAGLPPTILTSGTRDLFLSNTVRLHRALRAVGVLAELHVFEGISHGQLVGLFDSAESKQAFAEVIAFLNRHVTHA